MIPKRVTLKNFLSFGDEEQVLDFTENEALWVLTGPNGVGKSAVFDAITYCLFGQHRAGKSDAKSLIRHGANSFKVVFEFEFNGMDYRITRTRGGNITQKAEYLNADGHWTSVPNVNNATELDDWVVEKLGLKFDAFTASVLLRQGESDAIVEATGSARLGILNRIIDVSRYEELSGRIAEATKSCKLQLDGLKKQRETAREVTDEQIAEAQASLDEAVKRREAAQASAAAATERVTLAKQCAALNQERADLQRKLNDAAKRLAHLEEIREAHERFRDLSACVPALRKFVEARERLRENRERHERLAVEEKQATADFSAAEADLASKKDEAANHRAAAEKHKRDAERLGAEVTRESKLLETAREVQKLRAEAARFSSELDDLLAAAREKLQAAEDAVGESSGAKTEADTRLKTVKEQQAEFEQAGATCSRCGQKVGEKYAAAERAKFAEAIASFTAASAEAAHALKAANREKTAAKSAVESLHADVQKRKEIQAALEPQEKFLKEAGVSADAAELQQKLDAKSAEQKNLAAKATQATKAAGEADEAAKQLDSRCMKLKADQKQRAAELQTLSVSVGADERERTTLFGQLNESWQTKASTIAEKEVADLEKELTTLRSSGVEEQYQAVQSDTASLQAWQSRVRDVDVELGRLPQATIADAEADLEIERAKAKQAETDRDKANGAIASLNEAAERWNKLLADIASAETRYHRHDKLNDWLGKGGLQRELVRDAEAEIVRHAQETLGNLSGGDLEIELNESDRKENEALVLQVRRQGDPHPIPVKFLSGSQKFRVAVAIAVAIGRFAAGTSSARPLESVIIDEGFGSLDKDGLQSMREELENLKVSQSLKRVILVSHQEEFTSSFPIGYRLAAGPVGTTATRFRHS